jgi:Leucine-rich repeat (LRR) protein
MSVSALCGYGDLHAEGVDRNALRGLEAGGVMDKLRILRASGNRLEGVLRVGEFPNVRTLYVDENGIRRVEELERLVKLESVSMRNQKCREV